MRAQRVLMASAAVLLYVWGMVIPSAEATVAWPTLAAKVRVSCKGRARGACKPAARLVRIPKSKRRWGVRLKLPRPSRVVKLGKLKLRLFLVKVALEGNARYLGPIVIRVQVVPVVRGELAKKALAARKTIDVYIDGKWAGTTATDRSQAYLRVEKPRARLLNLAPGVHIATATVRALGILSRGRGTLPIKRGEARIKDATPPGILYNFGSKNPHGCHDYGAKVIVRARFAHRDYPSEPVVGAKVHYRMAAMRVCSAVTDQHGLASCSFFLNEKTMDKKRLDPKVRRPLVRSHYNFEMESTRFYEATSDRPFLQRSWCACPIVQPFYNPNDGICHYFR